MSRFTTIWVFFRMLNKYAETYHNVVSIVIECKVIEESPKLS